MKAQFEQNKGYISWLSIDGLKIYFDVTNTYVLNKLKIIFFPFLLKEEQWKRGQSGYNDSTFGANGADQEEDDLFTPRNDLQAPDLYIPLMSYVTFILITGFSLGLSSSFSSEKLSYVFSKTLFIWAFEALVLKGLFTCFNFGNPPFFELLCYTGYKFVILCIVMLAHIAGGLMVSYGAMALFGGLFCYFYYCTLRRLQTAHTLAEHTQSHGLSKKTF